MNSRYFARVLGRLGGRARAERLSIEQKKKIASLGGRSRARSIQASRRIVENFRYFSVLRGLSGKSNKTARSKTLQGRLPGIYPAEHGYARRTGLSRNGR